MSTFSMTDCNIKISSLGDVMYLSRYVPSLIMTKDYKKIAGNFMGVKYGE